MSRLTAELSSMDLRGGKTQLLRHRLPPRKIISAIERLSGKDRNY
jgi:hypothetical protein